MRKLGLLFLLLLLARASPAQVPAVSGSITTSSSNCSASAACVRLDLEDDAGAVSVTVSGTYSATLQFEGTGDGTNWVSVDATPFPSGTDVNSTTSTGTWRVNGAGLQAVRVRASAYTSGTASVTIRQGSVAVGSTGGGTGDIEGVTAGVGIGGGGTSGTVSITWAPEEQVDSVTLFDGANASRTFTFVLSGATDPTLTLANNSLSINVPVTADLVGDVTGNADTATTATTANAGDSATAFFSSGTLESTLLASDVVQEDIANTYTANLQDFALSTVKVPQASSCPVTLGLFCQDSDDQKVYIGDAVEADELQKTEDTYSTVTADTFPCGTGASFTPCTAGLGLVIDADTPIINLDFLQTLAGNPALLVSTVIPSDDCPGGGFISEGSTANTNEQLHCFISADGVDTTSEITENAAVQTLTNKTVDVEGTGNVVTTVTLIEWIAGVNQAATATGGCSTPSLTAPLPTATAGSATTPTFATLAFDATTDEYIQCRFWAPDDWTGVIDADWYWSAASTAGETEWCVAVISVGNSEAWNPTFNEARCVNDTADGSANDLNLASRTNILLTGVAANELVFIKIFRNADAGDEDSTITDDDDMTGDAQLFSFRLKMRRAQ